LFARDRATADPEFEQPATDPPPDYRMQRLEKREPGGKPVGEGESNPREK
jgi:hypothetical protein